MLWRKRFYSLLFQACALCFLLVGLHGNAAGGTSVLSVTAENAGWFQTNSVYRLHGTVMRTPDIDIVDIDMSFTVDEVPQGITGWQLTVNNIIWGPQSQCVSSPARMCNEWVATLSTSGLPPGDYNVNVRVETDMGGLIVATDVFGDSENERCSYNCGDTEIWPTCNAGLCQHGGMEPDGMARLLPANPVLVAWPAPPRESFRLRMVPSLL